MFEHFPYANMHDLNLDYLLNQLRGFEEKLSKLEEEAEALKNKQDKLTAGENITITPENVISATGGGGGGALCLFYNSNDDVIEGVNGGVYNYEAIETMLADNVPIYGIYYEYDSGCRIYKLAEQNWNNNEIMFSCLECNPYDDTARYHYLVINSDDEISFFNYYRSVTPDYDIIG